MGWKHKFAMWCFLMSPFVVMMAVRRGGVLDANSISLLVLMAGVVLGTIWLAQQTPRVGRAVALGILAGTSITLVIGEQRINHNLGLAFVLLGLLALNGIYFVAKRRHLKSEI